MSDVNTVTLVGRLTRNAETRITGEGLTTVSFSIASNRSKKRGEGWENEAAFVRLSVFGKRAEGLAPYLTKGRLIGVEGHLESRVIDLNGKKLSVLNVIAHNISLYSKPADNAETEYPAEQMEADYPPESSAELDMQEPPF